MRLLPAIQEDQLADPVRAKLSMVVPILSATLFSLNRSRVERFGGYNRITLWDIAREFREGSGDVGICFEWAVHEALANHNETIHALASEVLKDFCGIGGGSDSLLFGPEKEGAIPILESVRDSLSDDARIYVGNRGQPPKLRRYIPQIIRASRRNAERDRLPRSISGLWKADLFLGNASSEKWVGTTVKVNSDQLEGAQGLRIGIYPKRDAKDTPRRDESLNLVRLPLPYDGEFMELFYKSFFLVRAFLKADAQVPRPESLPDAEDRFLTQELQSRRQFLAVDVIEVLRGMSQPGLIRTDDVTEVEPTAIISEATGLKENPPVDPTANEYISLTPAPLG